MEEILIKTNDVSVRVLPLERGGGLPWHYHSEVADHIVALSGAIEVQLKSPEENVLLNPGERCTVPARRIHRVLNRAERANQYLLIQGIGRYDFNKVEP